MSRALLQASIGDLAIPRNGCPVTIPLQDSYVLLPSANRSIALWMARRPPVSRFGMVILTHHDNPDKNQKSAETKEGNHLGAKAMLVNDGDSFGRGNPPVLTNRIFRATTFMLIMI